MIVQNPIVGRSKNKLANTIFSTWNGLNIVRSKPLSVANPKSLAQRIQRARTSINAKFAKSFAAAINVGFRIKQIGQSARSQALKVNYPATSADPITAEPNIDLSGVFVAKGSMTTTPISTMTATGGSATVSVSFPNTAIDPSQSVNDKMVLCVVNADTGLTASSIGQVKRSAGLVSATFPDVNNTGNELQFYLFAYSTTDNSVSDSVTDSTVV